MAVFAKAVEPFRRGFLTLANNLPIHHTFGRLFCNLDSEQSRASFESFIAEFAVRCTGIAAIDERGARRSFDRASGKVALQMVTAPASGSAQRGIRFAAHS